ncbi:MAG: inorganic phosphate transporter [Sphingobacteriales bacterium]|nr:inorganic phosphate transporter [Sphingobacteriales bacterium]
MFGLETSMGLLLITCIAIVCIFEFINGFHDTANAVATVIYTRSLPPQAAVVWSGLCNFAGVMTGGIAVAVGIMNLLPIDILIEQTVSLKIALVLAALFSAIIWNLATWYVGIPCSSSHTLIGSLLGVGLVFSYLPENVTGVGVNWTKAKDIGSSLLLSPLFGFSMAIVLMFILRSFIQDKTIFKEPAPDGKPPRWIQAILITTCSLVSFFHGSNDGQKGVGLMMIVLMTFLPMQFALKSFEPEATMKSLAVIEQSMQTYTQSGQISSEVLSTQDAVKKLKEDIVAFDDTNTKQKFTIRKRINILAKNVQALLDEPSVITATADRSAIKKQLSLLKAYTDFAPMWVILLISLSLGLGTMIGWKRIVVTIGEKIGKNHMTYAQGATAELIAAFTIALSTNFGLPVSTTHVLSSGVAGAMVASKGVKNLQKGTIGNIALAWVLTLPVTIILSGALFYLFHLLAK